MTADHYRPGVRVRVAIPRDPYTRQIGVVHRTYNDAGDMIHVVCFPDGHRAEYAADELAGLNAEAW